MHDLIGPRERPGAGEVRDLLRRPPFPVRDEGFAIARECALAAKLVGAFDPQRVDAAQGTSYGEGLAAHRAAHLYDQRFSRLEGDLWREAL